VALEKANNLDEERAGSKLRNTESHAIGQDLQNREINWLLGGAALIGEKGEEGGGGSKVEFE